MSHFIGCFSGYKFSQAATRTDVLAARDDLFAALQQFRMDADADLAAALQQELAGATARYQALKQAAGALDFNDLLARARDLIRGDESIRRYLQRKFKRVFVDEFQDTDPVQAEILLMLAEPEPTALDWHRMRRAEALVMRELVKLHTHTEPHATRAA